MLSFFALSLIVWMYSLWIVFARSNFKLYCLVKSSFFSFYLILSFTLSWLIFLFFSFTEFVLWWICMYILMLLYFSCQLLLAFCTLLPLSICIPNSFSVLPLIILSSHLLIYLISPVFKKIITLFKLTKLNGFNFIGEKATV